MKKSGIVIKILVCALLLGLVIYHLPQRRQTSMPVCNAAGEVSHLEIDVKYYRRLFSMPWVKGTVTLDGVSFRDTQSLIGKYSDGYSFWDWVWHFGDPDGVMPANTFFIKEEHDPSKMFQDEVFLIYVGEDNTFDNVFFIYYQHDESTSPKYYGPASTVEEARQLAEDQHWRFD